MFNWLKRKKKLPDSFNSFITVVENAVNSALSGKDLFNFMLRERNYSTTNRGLNLSAVYCAFSLYTLSISTLPRNVFSVNSLTGETIKRVSSVEGKHPGIRIFLHYANRSLSSDELMTLISNDLLVDGNFYALRELDSKGRTFNINYIHPSRIPKGNIKFTTGGEKFDNGLPVPVGTLAYRIETGDSNNSINSNAYYVTRDQIVHIKSSIPDMEYNRGSGIIENASRSLQFAENSEEYGAQFYKNGTNNQTFLSTDQVLGPDVKKDLETFFKNNPKAPLEDAFKTRILDRGIKPVNVTLPLGQLQFIETRSFAVEDVARWFSMPPELLHSRMGSKTKVGDMSELINNFIQFGIGPFITRIANQLRSELLPLASQLNYSFEFERIYLYRTVINEFSQAIRNLFEIGVLNRSMIGKLIGIHIDPKDKQNKQLYVPTNLMTVGHSLALEEKAKTSNNLLLEQTRAARLANDNYVAPTAETSTEPNPDRKDELDESPDQPNIDKKIRTAKNALIQVVNGLQEHYSKVKAQKRGKYEDDEVFNNSMETWEETKFYPLVSTTLATWNEIIPDLSSFLSADDIVDCWKTHSVSVIVDRIENETSV